MVIYEKLEDQFQIIKTLDSHSQPIYDFTLLTSGNDLQITSSSHDKTLKIWKLKLTEKLRQEALFMTLNGNLCDTFDHMKKGFNKQEVDEFDNIGRVRTIAVNPRLNHIACGDKLGYIMILNAENLGILNIIESHTD